jgi:hypothetical protein
MTDPVSLWITNNEVLFTVIILVVSVWSSIWKAFALWKAAKKHHMAWYIVMFIVSIVGILEILYIFWFSKIGKDKTKKA